MKKKRTVTVGIPTFVMPENITGILDALIRQKCMSIVLKEVLVFIDGNRKSTGDIIPKQRDKRIRVIRSIKRRGFGGAVFAMLEKTDTDVFVLLNDDGLITDKNLLEKMCVPFRKNKNIGLVGGKPVPLAAFTVIQEVGVTTYRVYDSFRYAIRQGNNKFGCDGMLLGLSRRLYTDLLLNSDRSNLGTFDSYLYFYCITRKFDFYHERTARIFYVYPSTIDEYISRNTRNNSNKYLLRTRFGSIVEKEYTKPFFAYAKAVLKVFIKYPFHTILASILGKYIKTKEMLYARNFQDKWTSLGTTKNLSG